VPGDHHGADGGQVMTGRVLSGPVKRGQDRHFQAARDTRQRARRHVGVAVQIGGRKQTRNDSPTVRHGSIGASPRGVEGARPVADQDPQEGSLPAPYWTAVKVSSSSPPSKKRRVVRYFMAVTGVDGLKSPRDVWVDCRGKFAAIGSVPKTVAEQKRFVPRSRWALSIREIIRLNAVAAAAESGLVMLVVAPARPCRWAHWLTSALGSPPAKAGGRSAGHPPRRPSPTQAQPGGPHPQDQAAVSSRPTDARS
jgi:hypothetical protein